MPPPPQSDPLEAESSTEVETTAVEHSALDDRSAKAPAAEQSDTPVSCEGPTTKSTTSLSAISSGVEDANESLPTMTPQPSAEKGSDNILDEMLAREEEVDKSMVQEDLGVVTGHISAIGNENGEIRDCTYQENTELVVQTDCGSAGVSPPIPTPIFTEHSQDDPDDSEYTAIVMLTPERSTESTADTASVDDDAEKGGHDNDDHDHDHGVREGSLIDQSVNPPAPDADETVELPSKHEGTILNTCDTSSKTQVSATAGECSPNVAAQIHTVLEDPTRIEDAKSPSTDSGNDGAGNLPAAKVGDRESINTESMAPESVQQNANVLGDATKLGAVARSIPPHLRPDRPVPRQWDTPVARRNWPVPSPRSPRPPYNPSTYQNNRSPVDAAEYARMSAQVMKMRDELQIAQKQNAEMRVHIEAEKQKSLDAAMSGLLTDLLRKQTEALDMKAKAQAKQHELRHRELKVEQLEMFLAQGQKQFHYELDQRGIQSMSVVEVERIRKDLMLEMKHQFASTESKLASTSERIRQQEGVLELREQQYKATIRDSVEREIKEKMSSEVQDRAKDLKHAEAEYQRGFIEGRSIGRNETLQAIGRKHYLEGYLACNRTQTALHKVRNGQIPIDSNELDFLFEIAHQDNLFNLGREVGMMSAQNATDTCEPVADQGRSRTTANQNMQTQRIVEVRDGQAQEVANKPAVKQDSVRSDAESEFAYTPPPKCQTFASSLRRTSSLHNGHVVLANSGFPSPDPKPSDGHVKVEDKMANLIDFT